MLSKGNWECFLLQDNGHSAAMPMLYGEFSGMYLGFESRQGVQPITLEPLPL